MIKRIFYILFSAILLLLFFIIYLATTQGGLNLSLYLANKLTENNFHANKATGTLIHDFHITNLSYINNKTSIKIQNIDISWRPITLLTGRLYIKRANIQNATIIIPKTKTVKKKQTKSNGFKLPISISAHNITLENISFTQDKTKREIQSAKIDFYTWRKKVLIKEFDINSLPHHITLKGDFWFAYPFSINLQGQINSTFANHPPINTTISIKGNAKTNYIASANVQGAFKASLNAFITKPFDDGSIKLNAKWNNVLVPYSNDSAISSNTGNLSITGPLSKYKINLKTDIKGTSIPPSNISISGTGNLKQINFDAIAINTLNGSINGSLLLGIKPQLSWNTSINIKQLNPSIQWPNWNGNINFHLSSKGNFSSANSFSLELNNLHGSLQHYPISGYVNFNKENNITTIKKSNLKLGPDSLEIEGKINSTWNVSWTLSASKFFNLIHNTRGSIKSTGKIVGARLTPHITSKLSLSQLTFNKLSLNTSINADINLNNSKSNKTTGKVEISTDNPLKLTYTSNKTSHYIFPKINFTALLEKTGSTFKLSANNENKKINLSVILPNYFINNSLGKNQKISGKVNVNLSDLSFLSMLVPELSNTNGKIKSDLNVTGTLENPILNGSIILKNAKTTINSIELPLHNINITCTANNFSKVTMNGSLYSGKSKLTLSGQTDIQQYLFPFSINLQGNNVLLYNNTSYQVFASPNIKLNYANNKISLTGNVTIPKARITPLDFSSATALHNDVIIVQKEGDENLITRTGFYLDLNVALGNNVYFSYGGLSANVGGKININLAPQQLTKASGSLAIIKGKYDAYGTKLSIDKGELIYTGGPIDNPGLNIIATKKIRNAVTTSQAQSSSSAQPYSGIYQNILVGMNVTGTLKNPKVKLFSDPAELSQSDILSYLLFSTPSGQASGGQAQLLLAAAESTKIG